MVATTRPQVPRSASILPTSCSSAAASTGGVASWPAIELWAHDLAARVSTSKQALLLHSLDDRRFLKHKLCASEQVDAREGIQKLLQADGELLYLRLDLEDALQDDLRVQELEEIMQAPCKAQNCGVWASSAGCETPLHFDHCHGFLVQVVGRKRFLLAAPEETHMMYRTKDVFSKNQNSSDADLSSLIEDPEAGRSRFAKILEATWFVADLNPGDILYTSPGWWHHVVSVDRSVSALVPFDPDLRDELPAFL